MLNNIITKFVYTSELLILSLVPIILIYLSYRYLHNRLIHTVNTILLTNLLLQIITNIKGIL